MIKTIKVKKQLRLNELIKYVWENGIDNENYYSDLGNHVSVGVQSLLWTNSTISKNDTFTVEVEEEITEDTVFDSLIEITVYGDYIDHGYNISISDVKGTDTLRLYALIDKKLELIWEAK